MLKGKTQKMLLCAPLLGSVLLSGFITPAQVKAAEFQLHTITVVGKGEIDVQPDIAIVQLALQTNGKTAKEAQNANAKQFANIMKALKNLNIADKDIQTIRYSTYPNYSYEKQKQELIGYQVEQAIQVTYRQLDNVGSLLDKVTAAGANRIDNVMFNSGEIEKYQEQATEEAIDNARLKAEQMAKRAGVTIKEIVQMNENGTNPGPIFMNTMGSSASMDAKAAQTQLYPGAMNIQEFVTVTYSF
ncbi:SIMPL domain-containing protein [Aneurinibacillus terranovensis]|uniref:SIMPL domain-containing protein n=1 Tax=Aneurinibacillus terranovensis TaxID=278991 RepID=UPI0004050288|nr:SIMPL domain-containing protein [Aneurinibacillus terranovensis]